MADSNTHEIKIVINGDSNAAVGALKRVVTALHSVRSAASKLMSVFGIFGMAVHGVQSLINAVKWLTNKLTEASRELAKFKWDTEMRNAANETARLVGWHEKLAKLMKDELDTLNKQRAIANITAQGKKDFEDGQREADRARQIYEAKTPEEQQALRNRFAAEDEQRARDERQAQRKSDIERLDKEESVYSSKARSLRDNNADIDKQLENEKFNLVRANGKEDEAEPIKKRIEALKKRKEANEAEIAQFEKEAKFRRDQIDALKGQKDYTGPTAGEWQRRGKAEEDAKKKAEAKQRELEDKKLEGKKQKEIAALDPNAEDYDERKAKIERQYAEKEAQLKVERAKEEDRAIAEQELKNIQAQNAIADRESEARKQAEQKQRAEQYEDRLAGEIDSWRPRNRLTAMGLDSGATADHTAQDQARNVKKLVDLLTQQVDLTRNANHYNTAVFAP